MIERLLVLGRDDDERRVLAPGLEQRAAACFVDGVVERRRRRAAPSVPAARGRESAPRSAARRALRFTLTSKLRITGGNATPPPVNCGARIVPGAGAAGALLAPRLRAAAGDEAAALRAARARAVRVQLGAHGLVHEVRLHLGAEDGLLERDVLARRAAAEHRCLRARPSASASRISTMPFFGPGTAPLTSSRLRSASTSCTTRPDLRDALAAHAAGHLHALEDARRRRRRADRARLADVVRAVRLRAAAEVVALDRAGEALADRRSRRP